MKFLKLILILGLFINTISQASGSNDGNQTNLAFAAIGITIGALLIGKALSIVFTNYSNNLDRNKAVDLLTTLDRLKTNLYKYVFNEDIFNTDGTIDTRKINDFYKLTAKSIAEEVERATGLDISNELESYTNSILKSLQQKVQALREKYRIKNIEAPEERIYKEALSTEISDAQLNLNTDELNKSNVFKQLGSQRIEEIRNSIMNILNKKAETPLYDIATSETDYNFNVIDITDIIKKYSPNIVPSSNFLIQKFNATLGEYLVDKLSVNKYRFSEIDGSSSENFSSDMGEKVQFKVFSELIVKFLRENPSKALDFDMLSMSNSMENLIEPINNFASEFRAFLNEPSQIKIVKDLAIKSNIAFFVGKIYQENSRNLGTEEKANLSAKILENLDKLNLDPEEKETILTNLKELYAKRPKDSSNSAEFFEKMFEGLNKNILFEKLQEAGILEQKQLP